MVLPFRIQIKPPSYSEICCTLANQQSFPNHFDIFSTIVKAVKGQADVKVKTCIFKVSFKIV